ncbi:MAG: PilZ domain-containing protein [Planctomycetota bacterium]|jgi:hypothetical protein
MERDRRAHERIWLARPCKVYDPALRRYLPGTTRNLSTRGAFIQVNRRIDHHPGDRLYLGIALKRRQGILPAADMHEVAVVWSSQTTDGRTGLAVRFLDEAQASAAQARRAA